MSYPIIVSSSCLLSCPSLFCPLQKWSVRAREDDHSLLVRVKKLSWQIIVILPWQVVIHSSRCNSRKNILRVVVVGSVKIGYHFTLVLFFHNFALEYWNFQSPFLNVIVLNVDCLDALFAFQFFFSIELLRAFRVVNYRAVFYCATC